MLTTYVLLLLLIPSGRTVMAVGSLGRPALLWGLLCLMWWVWTMLTREDAPKRGWQPVRIALFAFLVTLLASYASASINSLPADEVSPLNAAMIRAASWSGVLLLANDGLVRADQIRALLRRIVVLGGILAVLGLAQFVTGDPLVSHVQIPGMSEDSSAGVAYRGEFTRASGTAAHPLEYAVVLSAALPLAIAVALREVGWGHLHRWWPPVSLGLASLVSVSRSAIVGSVLGILVLLPALSRAVRWAIAAVGLTMLTVAYVAVPGLIGTIRGMFVLVGSDSSAASRTDAAGGALQIASNYGPFGRGFGSFLPKYLILDNQILGLYIEIGAVGLTAFLALIAVGLVTAISTARSIRGSEDAILAQALAAALAGSAVLFLFFDALSFTMSGGMLFLLLGIIGAARQSALGDRAVATVRGCGNPLKP